MTRSHLLHPLVVAALLALLTGGCLETTFRPDPNADIGGATDISTSEDVDAVAVDSGDTGGAEVDGVDGTTGDVADTTDADVSPDVAPDGEAETVGNDTLAGDADAEVDSGPVGLPFGNTCTTDADCTSQLCLPTGVGEKLCTTPCEGDCPAGFRCGLLPATGSELHFCLPLPGDLCKPCATDNECTGGLCLTDLGGADPICGLYCDEAAGGEKACPAGFVCQSFLKGELCVPAHSTCDCSEKIDGVVWSCAVQSPLGSCGGTQVCVSGSWTTCSAPLPSNESCDGIDNNCDGATDEGFALSTPDGSLPLGTPCGIGVCAAGQVVCAEGGQGAACSGDALKASIDLCGDKLDNDCDGKTDEECPEADTDGDKVADSKDCAPYDAGIYPGAPEPCCELLPVSGAPQPEGLDAKTKGCDLDCNGLITACKTGDSDGDGFSTPADCDDGNPNAYPGGKEKCGDGVDQDCDGNDLPCTGLTDNDNDGYPLGIDCNDDDETIHPLAPEACNFLDDDCDGVVDEGNPGGSCSNAAFKNAGDCTTNGGTWSASGGACGSSVGACTPGTLVCNHVGLSANVTCVDATLPAAESCNEADDDCDGKTDEDFGDLGKACDGPDLDACSNGKYVCAPDGVGVTCGLESKLDILEQCNAQNPAQGNLVDEDCDGQTDEVCWADDVDGDGVPGDQDCNDADAGVFPGATQEACCDPALQGSTLAVELCDKNCDGNVTWCDPKDLDFDGKTGGDDCDETNPNVYLGAIEKCGDGVDQDCDGKDLSCAEITDNDGDGYAAAVDCNDKNPDIHPGAIELCNLKDDDCDKLIDEGNPEAAPTACGPSVGACKPGKEVCVRQQFKAAVLCVPQVGPQPELCNGIDDNCNGQTDESYPNLGQPCDGDDPDSCATGTFTCAADGSSAVCVNETNPNQIELCDGADNDCDGETDEGMLYFGKAIGADCDGQGACGPGKVVCSPELAVAVCSTDQYGTTPGAKPETCDGIDNDCDGLTDEGMTYGGAAVGGSCQGSGGCAAQAGKVECGPEGAAICSTMPGGTAYAGKTELCNGIDDDCDGRVDEGLGLVDSTCKQQGVCATGGVKAQCIAGAWKCDYAGVAGYQGDKEVLCDSVDNDCDGKTDEEFAVGTACDGDDSDLCANGIVVCSADKLFGQCGVETPANIVDVCNGKDDDCDGQTDEDFPIGQPCDGDDPDLCPTGTWTCAADGTKAECVNEPPAGEGELCNGKDDDCDGETDEGFSLGEACDGADSDQCKNGTFSCAPDGKSNTCVNETTSDIAEICDGNDNDCDGATDEEQLYEGSGLGKPCKGVGACGNGNVVCSPNTQLATCSTNPDAFLIFDGKELCDGLDNDCNGKTDDDLAWKGNALGASCPGQGECGAGKVICGTDQQVTCSTLSNGNASQSKPEVCDGKDNDCDGETDNGLGLADSTCKKLGVCATGAIVAACTGGKWVCDYSKIVGYQEVESLCDGIDNDCDGETDEGFQVGKACDGDDADQCKNGTWQCSKDGKSAVCENEVMTSIPEVCDGQDNDCDGFTDENFTYDDVVLGGPCDGVGECGTGKVMCGKVSKIAVCSTDPDGSTPQGSKEICDNKDNDCNGQTDDTLKFQGLPVGAPCSGIGECGLGVVECNPITKVPVCSSNPDGTESKSIFEQCNGKDDDCDGQSDEDVDPSTNNCNKQGACFKALVPTCTAGKWSCAYSGAGYQKTETFCDDVDNDCNGITDDPFPDKGKACDGPDVDVCKNGKLICAQGKASLTCGPEAPVSTDELCDGLDNDCDGKTDEDYPLLGQVCDGADTDQCKNGTYTCAANQKTATCTNEFPTDIVEICDGKDNDCDGQTDEGFGVGDACDGPDADQCKFGKIICNSSGKAECGTETKLNIKEICNNIDDDCDGTTDEGFTQKGQKCDSSTDTDLCKTGTFVCSEKGTLICAGDMECAVGTACKSTNSNTEPEQCTCGSSTCAFDTGDECIADKCFCNSGATCKPGQVCSPGKGCVSQ
ncbi:MAG: putative metal-binding motif-containing protein [Deltaproteobacteria bacterium]|nr:putative metal-binding motif-containing protein [Deltaproteobacteria bacterium]